MDKSGSYILTCLFIFSVFVQVMDVLMSLQGSQMESDDPTTSYMLQVYFDH